MNRAFRSRAATTGAAPQVGVMRRVLKRSGVVLAVASLLLVLVWSAIGCGPEVGATQEMLVDEPLASAAVTDVRLVMGAGSWPCRSRPRPDR